MTQLSKNFELSEFLLSQTAIRKGIKNEIPAEHLANLKALVTNVLQPFRTALDRPFMISSGYRSAALNTAVKGSKTSQHCLGQAVDFNVAGMTPLQVCHSLLDLKLPFDQLIYEGGWVHLSYTTEGNRMAVLTATFVNGKAKYEGGLP